MSENKSFNFKSFVSANAGKHVSSADYLRAIHVANDLPADFIVCFSRLFWPEFKILNGAVYLSELFESERYETLASDETSPTEIQFWMNLIEITGLFDELPLDDAIFIAEALSSSWNSKMALELESVPTPARAIIDNESGEVFVTIGKAE